MKTKPVLSTKKEPSMRFYALAPIGAFLGMAVLCGPSLVEMRIALDESEAKESARSSITEERYSIAFPTQTLERLDDLWVGDNPQILSDVDVLVGNEEVSLESVAVSLTEDRTSFLLYTFNGDGELEELDSESL